MYHLNLILFYTQYLVIVKFHTIIVKDPRDSLYFQQIKTKNVVPIKKLKYNLFLSFPSVKITVSPPPKKKKRPTNYFTIHTLIYPSYLIFIFTSKFSTNSNYMFSISSYPSFSSLLILKYLCYFCSILQFETLKNKST